MSNHTKLVTKFLSQPNDFTFDELRSLLSGFEYEEKQGGKTSGSRVAFIHVKNKHIIRIHNPHPGNELKGYQVTLIRNELKEQGAI